MTTLHDTPVGRNCPRNDKPESKSRRGKAQLLVRYRLADDPPGKVREAAGRYGWTLLNLYRAGSAGLTTLERPAPRWSHYVYILRGEGVEISTEYEKHSGAFSGNHGRYRLLSNVNILEVIEPAVVPHA
jgi:hypothetical protein